MPRGGANMKLRVFEHADQAHDIGKLRGLGRRLEILDVGDLPAPIRQIAKAFAQGGEPGRRALDHHERTRTLREVAGDRPHSGAELDHAEPGKVQVPEQIRALRTQVVANRPITILVDADSCRGVEILRSSQQLQYARFIGGAVRVIDLSDSVPSLEWGPLPTSSARVPSLWSCQIASYSASPNPRAQQAHEKPQLPTGRRALATRAFRAATALQSLAQRSSTSALLRREMRVTARRCRIPSNTAST